MGRDILACLRADGEVALAGLLRIGPGLEARVRYASVRDGVLGGVLLGLALVLALVSLGVLV